MPDRLSTPELQDRFLAAIGPAALVEARRDTSGALVVELRPPLPNRVRVYIYNATNPPGGRSTLEHKIQLTHQPRGERGNFDWSGVDFVLLCGFAAEQDVFVFWDAALHVDFGYSTNLQVRTAKVQSAAESGVIIRQERDVRTGREVVICAPSELVVPAIAERASGGGVSSLQTGVALGRGRSYVRPTTGGSATPKSRVFSSDPDAIDRATNAHKRVQNQLADAVKARGWEPLSPGNSGPLFDVAWIAADTAWIAEVKSLTIANEDRQLRLGLGQVLSYVHLIDWGLKGNRAVLAVERKPSSAYWPDLCESHGVALWWPEVFDELLDSGV